MKEVIKKAGANELEIKRIDDHYRNCCKAILRTNGIMIRDVDEHNIHKEH